MYYSSDAWLCCRMCGRCSVLNGQKNDTVFLTPHTVTHGLRYKNDVLFIISVAENRRNKNGEKAEKTILFDGKPVGLAVGLLTPQLILVILI